MRWRGWATGWVVILALVLLAVPVSALGLGGTKHDFSKGSKTNPFSDAKNACDPCHQYLTTKLPTKIGGIDVRLRSTAVCLSCHADTGRPEVSAKVKLKCTFGINHPVDIPLPDSPKFRKPEEMPQLVFYGKERLMGCTTCHDTHNGKGLPNFLRTAGDNDALCTTCHNF